MRMHACTDCVSHAHPATIISSLVGKLAVKPDQIGPDHRRWYCDTNKCIGDDTKATTHQSLDCIKNKKKIKYGEKRFSICRMEFLHPAMWHGHDHDIDFVMWLHPAMWHVALESWQWIHQVAEPYNVIHGSRMTCHWIRPNVRHIGILHLVSISTTLPQSTCHSVPVCEILSKSDHPLQKKMTSCRFSRWQISAILDCRDPIMGFLKSPVKLT